MPEISPLLGSTPTTPAPSGPDNSMGKDAFLKLLVAQLRNQNPMNPMDGSEFIAQTAQLTMVEKMEELAKTSADALADNRGLAAASLVGRTVSFPGDDGAVVTGVVSAARFSRDGAAVVVDGREVPLALLREVRPTPPPAPDGGGAAA